MHMSKFNELFIERTRCMIFQASSYEENCASWIGGRAPEFFDDKVDLLNKNGMEYHFYLTLLNPFQAGRMISIFIPPDYEEYSENNIYPDCSIQVFEHPTTSESTKDLFVHPELIKHSITGGELIDDKESMETSFLLKIGGTPKLIQDENYYFSKLTEDLFEFMFQVDEDGYTMDLVNGNLPFNFGALYVFANILNNKEIRNPIAGFWQYS